MNRRVLILLLLLIIVIGGGALLYFTVIAPASQAANNIVLTTIPDPNNPNPIGVAPVVNTPTPISFTPILIAVQELPRGIRIPENGVEIRNFPTANVPANAIGANPADPNDVARVLKDVVGKIARTDIAREQPLLYTMLVDDLTQIAKVGSDAAAVIPPGLQAITLPIDRNSAVAFAPRPGDYVDVIVSYLFVDVDEEFQSRKPNLLNFTIVKQDGTIDIVRGIAGRVEPSSLSNFPVIVGPSETQRPRLTTQRTIQAALVIQMGTFPLTGNYIGNTPTPAVPPTVANDTEPTRSGPPTAVPTQVVPEVITVAVQPQEAIVLAWLIEARVPLTLTLRNARDVTSKPSTPVNLRYVVEQYQVQQPPKLPYALEPAIRSVRQLVTGTLVPFASDVQAQPAK